MSDRMFRLLRADEIECRVAQVAKDNSSLSLLLYKDARCDMNLLDEVVGAMNWKKEYSRDNANCTVSIWDEKKAEWVSKEDTGTDSNMESEKGRASDSFKRACVNWGIGRELYTAPSIWIRSDCYKVNSKGSTYDRFYVSDIGYDETGRINYLVIYNQNSGQKVYSYGNGKSQSHQMTVPGYPSRDIMLEVVKTHYPEGKVLDKLLTSFGVDKIEDASDAQLIAVYNKYEGQ